MEGQALEGEWIWDAIATLNIFINDPPLTIVVLSCLFTSCLCLNDVMIVYKYRSGGRWGALLFSDFFAPATFSALLEALLTFLPSN
jgi:hypothetical protein